MLSERNPIPQTLFIIMYILVKLGCILIEMLNPSKNNDLPRFKTRVFPSKQSAVRKSGNLAQLQSFENQILAKQRRFLIVENAEKSGLSAYFPTQNSSQNLHATTEKSRILCLKILEIWHNFTKIRVTYWRKITRKMEISSMETGNLKPPFSSFGGFKR